MLKVAYEGTQECPGIRLLEWPRKAPSLSQQHWNDWQTAMDECFLQPYSQEKLLHRPLGPWTVDPKLTCEWVYSRPKAFCSKGSRFWQGRLGHCRQPL